MDGVMYDVEKLLWHLRKHPDLAQRFRDDPDEVLDRFGVDGRYRTMLKEGDFRGILEAGANPYLLYFFALQVGVDRADYYAAVRGAEVG